MKHALKPQMVYVVLYAASSFCLHVMYDKKFKVLKPTCWFTAAAALAAAGCAKDWSYVGGGPWAAAAAAYSCAWDGNTPYGAPAPGTDINTHQMQYFHLGIPSVVKSKT